MGNNEKTTRVNYLEIKFPRDGLHNPSQSESRCVNVHIVKPALNSSPIPPAFGPLGPVCGPSPILLAKHQVQLVQEFNLARALGDKLESGGSKADLFHLN